MEREAFLLPQGEEPAPAQYLRTAQFRDGPLRERTA